MIAQSVIHLSGPASATPDGPLRELLKRCAMRPFARPVAATPSEVVKDPYLLLLLADQELVEGREEQARYLVEAAYDSFDQNARAITYNTGGVPG